jgi:phenylalanyl-tRNA synthetase alpha chain
MIKNSMPKQIQNLKNQAISNILEAKTESELEDLRINYLGRKGKITQILKQIPSLPIDRRIKVGKVANDAKTAIEEALATARINLLTAKKRVETEWIDVTAPGIYPPRGHLHLITSTIQEISRIFERIGFVRVRYPEIEWDWYAFTGLNMPENHPARDEWETFFIADLKNEKGGGAVLTPHTSSGQLREMERKKPPFRMLNIAKCYRRQSDISHTPMFYQFEGLVIEKDVNITHLKGVLDYFAHQYFNKDRKTRIRPSHFRFTEPSFEIDISCDLCKGQGCRLCREGWLELGGAGMVHPAVLKNGKINPEKYTGFAFGWGVERVLMMKYGINDIRLLFSGNLKFLSQF